MPARRHIRRATEMYIYMACAMCLSGCGTFHGARIGEEAAPLTEPIVELDRIAVETEHMGLGVIERDPKTGTARFSVTKVAFPTSRTVAYDLKLRVETPQGYREVRSRLDDHRQIDNAIPVFFRFHVPAGEYSFVQSDYGLMAGGEREPMAMDWFLWLNGDGMPIKLTVYEEGGDLLVRLKRQDAGVVDRN